ncbi:phospholipid scramblase-related protein [Corallococcus macrosporus]|uniref:Scramblase n=1 Tax=Corallococcus macrosporus DSM 14697 TaxID=1189310 RepID=A0A250JLR7_9BACT|nr:phospholipid scramblase-related protein [Corallococcus macrosporus]ATB44588.1 scramblase [Corallococcus macrosporus DSM 14697]
MSDKPSLADTTELELDWRGREPRKQEGPASAALEPLAEVQVPSGAGKGLPGDPRHMSTELNLALRHMMEAPGLRMRQFREGMEIIFGAQTRNRYEVCDEMGRVALYVEEEARGFGAMLRRTFWPFYKARMECMTPGGIVALVVERPWSFIFTKADIFAWDGRLMARIQQRFTLLGRQLDLVTPGGAVIATVKGPLLRPWTFRVFQNDLEVAVVRKRWSGLFQEAFSSADTFTLDFMPQCADFRLRQLVLAVALLVDLTYFENNSSRSAVGPGMDLLDVLMFWKR